MRFKEPIMRILTVLGLAAACLTGCLNFDGMVHNPVHCSSVSTVLARVLAWASIDVAACEII